jgi:hypothetical protein
MIKIRRINTIFKSADLRVSLLEEEE